MANCISKLARLMVLAALALCLVTIGPEPSFAADQDSVCRQLSKVQCTEATSCIWRKSYKTKSGTKIRARCLAKNKSKSSVLGRLLNSKKSSTSITRITSKKKVYIKRNLQPADKMK